MVASLSDSYYQRQNFLSLFLQRGLDRYFLDIRPRYIFPCAKTKQRRILIIYKYTYYVYN